MLDPVSAFTLAVSAFNGVKKLVEAGREIEDVAGQLGKWFGAVAQHRQASEKIKNPPLFRKLLDAGSVEQQALEITIHEQKFREMETQLREIIMYRYGQQVYLDMLRTRARLREERERAEKQLAQRRENFVTSAIVVVLAALTLAVLVYVGNWLYELHKLKG
jgi:hypothetical protein